MPEFSLSTTIEDKAAFDRAYETLEGLTEALSNQHDVGLKMAEGKIVVQIDEDGETAGLIQQQLDRQLKGLGLPIKWDR